MKKIFMISCMLLLAYTTFGQQIRSRDVDIDDIMTLLRASGYELFSFDITEMLNERYDIHFIKKEFEAGEEIATTNLVSFPIPNQVMLTDRTLLLERVNLGFYPSGNDSTKLMNIHAPEVITWPNPIRFNLKALRNNDLITNHFFYEMRPFATNTFRENEFIPLVLLGSAWWDEQLNTFRFCVENEFNPDMSSETLKLMPHYFVVGIRFDRSE